MLAHKCLRVPQESAVWILFDTYGYNLDIKMEFTKYLKKS